MGLTSLRPGSSKDKESSKATKKFDKKLQFYTKVGETVAALGAKKAIGKKKKLRSRQKKLKAYDLSLLTESLPELKSPKEKPIINLKMNCKRRQELVKKEHDNLNLARGNPLFKADPLAAIYQHLQSTQPVVVEKPAKKSSKTGKKSSKTGKKKIGKKSKTSSGPQSMEI